MSDLTFVTSAQVKEMLERAVGGEFYFESLLNSDEREQLQALAENYLAEVISSDLTADAYAKDIFNLTKSAQYHWDNDIHAVILEAYNNGVRFQ